MTFQISKHGAFWPSHTTAEMQSWLLVLLLVLACVVSAAAAPKEAQNVFFISTSVVVNKICDLLESRWKSHGRGFGPAALDLFDDLYNQGLRARKFYRPAAIAWMLAGGVTKHATQDFLVDVFASSLFATGVGELQALLTMAAAFGGNMMVCTVFFAWQQANPGVALAFSCVLPMALYPCTPEGAVACLLNPHNIILYSTAANILAGWTWPPTLWWLLSANAQESVIVGWLMCFCNLKPRDTAKLDKLAKGLMILPGRWVPGLTGPDKLLQKYLEDDNITVSQIAGLKEAIDRRGQSYATPAYTGDADLQWQCEDCLTFFFRQSKQSTVCGPCFDRSKKPAQQ